MMQAEEDALRHTDSCPQRVMASDDPCTCGLQWRDALATEQTMHAAWRKRAEEVERDLAARDAEIGRLRKVLYCISVVDQGCGGNLTYPEMVESAKEQATAALAPQPATEAKPDAYSRQMDLLDGKVPENPLPDPMHTRY